MTASVIMELLTPHDSEGPHPPMPSSLIATLTEYAPAVADSRNPVTERERCGLLEALARVPDPRSRRGIRYRFASLLAVAVCAVCAGAATFAAICDWAHDLGDDARRQLGWVRLR